MTTDFVYVSRIHKTNLTTDFCIFFRTHNTSFTTGFAYFSRIPKTSLNKRFCIFFRLHKTILTTNLLHTSVVMMIILSARLNVICLGALLFWCPAMFVVDGMCSLLFCGFHVVSTGVLFVCEFLCDECCYVMLSFPVTFLTFSKLGWEVGLAIAPCLA